MTRPNIYDEKEAELGIPREEVKQMFWLWLYGKPVACHLEEHMRDIAVVQARKAARELGAIDRARERTSNRTR